jgi:hypothetical protein
LENIIFISTGSILDIILVELCDLKTMKKVFKKTQDRQDEENIRLFQDTQIEGLILGKGADLMKRDSPMLQAAGANSPIRPVEGPFLGKKIDAAGSRRQFADSAGGGSVSG